ncbi:MAG: tetratricopeptide repeat protein, partial [Pirellulaceae bacterium]|nr:tetratricopeptide repeat protein [Pirellulaceae bacterium]
SAGCRLPWREGPVSRSLADSRRLSQRGVAALEQGRLESAENLLAQAVAACPEDAEARRHHAEAVWRRGDKAAAIAHMQEALKLVDEDASMWQRLAEMYLADGRAELARDCAEKAMDLDPKLPGAWAARGGAMLALGNPRDALNDYLRALGHAPGDREILLQVAELYRQLDQPLRALQTLQGLADRYSPGEEPARVLYLTGLAQLAVGRHDDAVESLTAAVTRGQPTPEMYCRLGEAQLAAGRQLEAEAAVRQSLDMQPGYPPGVKLMQRIEVARSAPPTMTR